MDTQQKGADLKTILEEEREFKKNKKLLIEKFLKEIPQEKKNLENEIQSLKEKIKNVDLSSTSSKNITTDTSEYKKYKDELEFRFHANKSKALDFLDRYLFS
jgi:hypothetical protein